MPLVPISWLASHVDVPADLTPEQLAAALVRVGLEEETIHEADVTGPVVVGHVLTREAKEQSNGKVINYCRVDVGQYNDAPGSGKEPSELPSRGIICGAHNFEAGDYVVVSLPGAVLPGGFEIAARKTYGHISDGMICSARELGLGEDHNGIIVLARADDTEAIAKLPAPGSDALELLGLGGRTLEINITPDRGYCFSMRGVAREYHHSTGAAFTDPALREDIPAASDSAFPVRVDDDAPIHGQVGCDRFVTRIVRGIDPAAPSPQWMQNRLKAAGMRPISLAVDATNYVMLDLGQPLHAYDLDKVDRGIVVRRARLGEKLTTLDEVTRELDPEDLLITDGADGSRVLGLAGVMGGADTEITSNSVNVLIEAAHFDPVSIARTARRHKLPSEASKRFERGVDPKLPPAAAAAVVDLLVRYGGGVAGGEVGDLNTTTPQAPQEFPLGEVERLTGLNVSPERIIAILEDIGCDVTPGEGAMLLVTPPSWRPDLIGSAHFVEEVARLVGYDEIPVRTPLARAGGGLSVAQRERRDMMANLAARGWVEVLSYPFIGVDSFEKQGIGEDDSRRRALRLANPLQDDAPYLRTSILDTLLATASMNVARGNTNLAIFETGLVARPGDLATPVAPGVGERPSDEAIAELSAAIPSQPRHLAGVACGNMRESEAGYSNIAWDWRDALEAACLPARTIGLKVSVANTECAPFHPGRCAVIHVGKIVVGYGGELHPRVCAAFGLPARSVAFEVDVDAVIKARGNDPITVDRVLTSPAAKEDMAFVVDETLPVTELVAIVKKAGGDRLEHLHVFDVFSGEQVGEGKKSVALALRLRGEATLTSEEIAGLRKKIIKQARKVGAQLRG